MTSVLSVQKSSSSHVQLLLVHVQVRCLELRELLEEQEMDEGQIEVQVCKFRAKLMEEKKKLLLKDSSGRPM